VTLDGSDELEGRLKVSTEAVSGCAGLVLGLTATLDSVETGVAAAGVCALGSDSFGSGAIVSAGDFEERARTSARCGAALATAGGACTGWAVVVTDGVAGSVGAVGCTGGWLGTAAWTGGVEDTVAGAVVATEAEPDSAAAAARAAFSRSKNTLGLKSGSAETPARAAGRVASASDAANDTALTRTAEPGFMPSASAALGDRAMKTPGLATLLTIVTVTVLPFSRLLTSMTLSRGKELQAAYKPSAGNSPAPPVMALPSQVAAPTLRTNSESTATARFFFIVDLPWQGL
jgi:hypothetical protein